MSNKDKEANLWRIAAKCLAEEFETLIDLINETVTKDNPLPLPPSVTLYKLTAKAIDASERGDHLEMALALREARQVLGVAGS